MNGVKAWYIARLVSVTQLEIVIDFVNHRGVEYHFTASYLFAFVEYVFKIIDINVEVRENHVFRRGLSTIQYETG